jgi:hypothetical protein
MRPALLVSLLLLSWQPCRSRAIAADAETFSIDVGTRKQLLVDDFVVAELSGVTRTLGTVRKANGGAPIFTDGWFYGTVLHDAGRFKLWFRKPGTQGYGYAESADGLSFDVQADVAGIPFAGDYTLAVEIDPHASDPQRRYLAGYDAVGMAAGVAYSPDGIRWTSYLEGRPVTTRAADTYNQVLWDPLAETYRLFTRTDFGTPGGGGEVRGTRSMTNPDLHGDPANWRLVRAWQFDREGSDERLRRQSYAATCWIYEGVYFALLSVYEHPGDVSEGTETDLHTRHERDVMNCYLATSRDGDAWDLQWVYAGRPLVPRGPDGAFDKDLVLAASTIVTHDDRHWIYYAGGNERHGTEAVDPPVRFDRQHAIGLAHLRLDGFVALSAGAEPGTVTTRPFRLAGRHLEVNVAAPMGDVGVEVLDADGTPLEGFTGGLAASAKQIDDLRWRPQWAGGEDLAPLVGRTIRLRFRLCRARLYAFQVQER